MDTPTKIKTTKFIARNIVATSVSFCVGAIIQQNVAVEKPADKAKLAIGSFAIGAMVADKSKEYVDNTVDELVSAWSDLKQNLQKDR